MKRRNTKVCNIVDINLLAYKFTIQSRKQKSLNLRKRK